MSDDTVVTEKLTSNIGVVHLNLCRAWVARTGSTADYPGVGYGLGLEDLEETAFGEGRHDANDRGKRQRVSAILHESRPVEELQVRAQPEVQLVLLGQLEEEDPVAVGGLLVEEGAVTDERLPVGECDILRVEAGLLEELAEGAGLRHLDLAALGVELGEAAGNLGQELAVVDVRTSDRQGGEAELPVDEGVAENRRPAVDPEEELVVAERSATVDDLADGGVGPRVRSAGNGHVLPAGGLALAQRAQVQCRQAPGVVGGVVHDTPIHVL